jgi:hypothetical protein
MKKFLIILAVASLGACGSPLINPNTGLPSLPNLSNTMKDEKALYAAEAGFKGVSLALNSAVDAGLLKGARAAQAKKLYDDAYRYLLIARRAQKVGDTSNMVLQATYALGLIADLQRLLTT